MWCGRLVDWSA